MAKFMKKLGRTLSAVASVGYSEYDLRQNKQAEQQRSQQIADNAAAQKAVDTKNQAIVDANFSEVAKKKNMLAGRSGSGKSLYSTATQSGLYTI